MKSFGTTRHGTPSPTGEVLLQVHGFSSRNAQRAQQVHLRLGGPKHCRSVGAHFHLQKHQERNSKLLHNKASSTTGMAVSLMWSGSVMMWHKRNGLPNHGAVISHRNLLTPLGEDSSQLRAPHVQAVSVRCHLLRLEGVDACTWYNGVPILHWPFATRTIILSAVRRCTPN